MKTSLKVTQNDIFITSLELDTDRLYYIGRHTSCDIVLEAESGVSRKHLLVSFKDGQWCVENLSKIKNLELEGEPQESFEPQSGQIFSVKDFEFCLTFESEEAVLDEAPSDFTEQTQPISMLDKTSVGQVALQPRLSISVSGQPEKTYVLKALTCVIGRDEACDVPVDAPKMSRKHFEIKNENSIFSIIDLGSSNGTYLNNKPINKNSYTQLKSGDVITASGAEIKFEVIDSEFANRVSNLPALAQPQPQHFSEHLPMPADHVGAKIIRSSKTKFGSNGLASLKAQPKKKLAVYATLAVVIISVASLFSGEPKKAPIQQTDMASKEVSFEKLSQEEKAVVRDTFNLARNHYMQGRYGLCKSEISKLHEVIPFYENSKELQTLCSHALDLERINEDTRRKQAERDRIEQRIQIVTSDCRANINKFKTENDLRACLRPAIEFDPEHPLVTELLTLLQAKEQEKQMARAQRAARQNRVRAGESKYRSAKRLYDAQKYSKAIRALSKYLAGSWPDPKNLKSKAKRNLASARVKLSELVEKEFSVCKSFHSEKKLKEAILACDKALEQDPNNDEVLSFRAESLSLLRKEMKFLYEDSILEESLGNVDAAKEKWRTIMKKDIDTDEYYRKAKSKLKKYGIGI